MKSEKRSNRAWIKVFHGLKNEHAEKQGGKVIKGEERRQQSTENKLRSIRWLCECRRTRRRAKGGQTEKLSRVYLAGYVESNRIFSERRSIFNRPWDGK